MKQKKGFRLRTVCGENVIVADGVENIDFSKIISMNETSAYLWRALDGKDFDAKTMAELLLSEYEVSKETALADAEALTKQWKEAGIIE